ncbi:MAG: hypothetical protein ACTSUO_09565 [Candidatus Thorarchaeota archaeon]
MNVDIVGLAIVLIAVILTIYTTRVTLRIYNEFGTEFFKYASIAFFCLSLMIGGYIFPAVFSDESLQWLVFAGQVTLTSFGQLSVALAIYALENTKEVQRESIINMGFFLSGLAIGIRFLPGEYLVLWTGSGWKQQYGTIMIGLTVIEFIFLSFILGPLALKIWKRIRNSKVYKTESKFLFVSFSILLLVFGAYMIAVNSLGIGILMFSIIYYIFLIPLAGFAAIAARLLHLYPTIFFSSSHTIFEIQFVSKITRNTVYRYSFIQENPDSNEVGISTTHDTIRNVFHETLEKQGEVKSIRIQENEIIACTGNKLYGLLVIRRGSELFQRLLVRSLKLFEETQSTTQYYEGEEFHDIMISYFQFAVHSSEENRDETKEVVKTAS